MKHILATVFLAAIPFPVQGDHSSTHTQPQESEVVIANNGSETTTVAKTQATRHKGKFIDYKAEFDGREFIGLGYLVLPEGASAENPVPGVIVVHEWWGQTEYPRRRAEMLAELGYAAFAIDM